MKWVKQGTKPHNALQQPTLAYSGRRTTFTRRHSEISKRIRIRKKKENKDNVNIVK